MPANLVKRCPTCGEENPPTAARCGCGAFLIGVDLTERASAVAAERAGGSPVAGTTIAAGASSPLPPREGLGVREDSSAAANPQISSLPATSGARDDSIAPQCSYDDCAQPNLLGTAICVYCNRPIRDNQPGQSEDSGDQTGPTHSGVIPAHAGIQGQERANLGSRLRGSDGIASTREDVADRPHAPAPANRPTLIRLPAKLATRFAIEEPLKAAGSEADLFVVRDSSSGEQAVLKLYRHGIEPDTEVLERVSRAAPDQLVHLLEHGRDEGVPYELLEYCPHGSLRTLLKGRPLPPDAGRTLLVELADAISHLHDCGIVHRDLKPENVLIRGLLPLDLVLTDFGIASVTQATMHHTSGARTLRYSAPEAGSNWVGKPTDYWALGMMLVEALSGRHPFDGLSDAVIAHWLVTRPIDVSGVTDPGWQQLCRGLLTRDPKARWGADEIARWLAGDASLTVALDERAAPAGAAIAPYRVGEKECRTPRELAVALAAAWSTGVKDLKRGMLRAWLQNDLRDQNLARAAADAEEALEVSDDERLLRLLLRLDPELPPVFKGYDVSIAGLAALTRKALEDHNEERQTVIELLDRRILERFPGSPLQEVHARFQEAKEEFEGALESAFAAGASRELAPEGREWQLRMLLFVLEPPKGLVENLRASARRVGGRAAQRCDWYRALGDPADASPARLAAMVLLGPPAAQQGMEVEREAARRSLEAIAMTVVSHARLREAHGETRDRLAATLETSQDEDELLAVPAQVAALSQAIERTLGELWTESVFDSRAVSDPERLDDVRRRIGEWASWKAGEDWARFGEQIELRAVTERRSYRAQLASQIEARRIPYKYGAADRARMPSRAQVTLDDVWSCAMPALPEFAADLKITRGQEVRCPRCNAVGRVELQEAWGSTAYPFSTTFACAEKVGVQCQTRLAWGNEDLPAAGVPAFVADFIEAHARQPEAPERTLQFMAPRIPANWIGTASEPLRKGLSAELEDAAREAKPGERVCAQRLRVTWTGLFEAHYRYRGKDYVVWIPERADALPIALEHPLPSAPGPAPAALHGEDDSVPDAAAADKIATDERQDETRAPTIERPSARLLPRWLRMSMWWGGALILVFCLLTWIVNWKP